MKKQFLALLLCLLLLPAWAMALERADVKIYFHGDEESSQIAITMDDCWRIKYVEAALDLCKEYGVHMTFFPCGRAIKPEDAAIWQRVIDEGHAIGNHTYSHKDLRKISADRYQLNKQFTRAQAALDAVLREPYQMTLLRPPYGDVGEYNINWLRDAMLNAGLHTIVKWNVSSTDPAFALKSTKNGSILLYHAQEKDVTCLQTLIPQLLEAGFEPVTLTELLPVPGAPETDKAM